MLLKRLQLPFLQLQPNTEEEALPGEAPQDKAIRLACEKAQAVAKEHKKPAVIIGADQVAVCNQRTLHKPMTSARAAEQLAYCAGQWVEFHSGLCLLDIQTDSIQTHLETYKVEFSPLTQRQIMAYVDLDQPLFSAGSFKAESLGPTLFERESGDDPTALVGLPLIALTKMLRHWDLDPLTKRDLFSP